MAWTSPRTWIAGEQPSAATMNTHIRDNLKAIGDAWTSYTPAVSGWTQGNGTLTGVYMQAGKWVNARVAFTVGSTTTIAGTLTLSLPVSAHAVYTGGYPIGAALLLDTSLNNRYQRFTVATSATTVQMSDLSNARVTATVPFTWATGDTVDLQVTYEAA